jgi:hypothetical protein
MKRLVLITVMAVSILSAAPATSETGSAGLGGAFMKFGLGARSLGMGSAFTGLAEGIDAIYYNPGGLGFSLIKQVGFTYHSLSLDRKLNSASLIYPVRNEAILGVSWINSSVGNVPMIDSDRNTYDEFSNSTNSFGLTFAKAFTEQLSAGGNLRYLQATLDQLNAYTIGVDMGLLYKPLPQYSVGLAVSDLGSNLRWDSSNYWSGNRGGDYDDKFPYRIRGGASGTFLDNRIIVTADVMKVENLDLKFYGGAEYWFTKKAIMFVEDEEAEDELREVTISKRILGLRGGYSDGSLTFGASLYYYISGFDGGFDYAFMTGKEGDGSYHILTMRVMF